MSANDFMSKVRQWDNRSNQWFVRHFYVLFFEIILVAAFVTFFVLTVNTINMSHDIRTNDITVKILFQQNIIGLMLVFLAILNSFWMLFMFSGLLKVRNVLKNMDFNLSRRRTDKRAEEND